MVTTAREDGRPRLGQGHVVLAVLVLAVLAWVALVVAPLHGGGHSGAPAHGAHAEHDPLRTTAATLGGWVIMVLAMMLPPALPLMTMVGRLVAGRRRAGWLWSVALLALVTVWVVVGAVLIAADAAVRATVGDFGSSELAAGVAGGALVLAGLFQFTRLKTVCLRACRTPRWFARRYWHGRHAARETAAIGGAYGLSCVGCCWALMAVCFVTGTAAIPAMVALALLMAIERLTRWGARVVRPVGAAFVVAGILVVTGVLPAVTLSVGG